MLLDPGRPALAFAGWVTQDAGSRLLAMSGHTVDELLKAADSPDFRPIPLEFRIKAHIEVEDARHSSRKRPRHVSMAAMARTATKSSCSGRTGTISESHFPVNGDAIYNGAIDNATGCGVVLEQARVFSELKKNPNEAWFSPSGPRKKAGFAAQSTSRAHPLFPPDKIAININYDALHPSARTKDIVVTGAERTTAVRW